MSSGNNTLSTLRTRVRYFLNEASAGFWTNDQIDEYINMSYSHYFEEYLKKHPSWGKREETLTYTASATSVTLTVTDGEPWHIDYIEDRTNSTPGHIIPMTTDKNRLHRAYNVLRDEIIDGGANIAYLEYQQSKTSGVFTNTCKVFLGPRPTSARSLVLHMQLAPEDMTGDSHTSGLPAFVERCVVLQAAIYAKVQEESPHAFLDKELKKADRDMMKNIRTFKRGPNRVTYNPRLNY